MSKNDKVDKYSQNIKLQLIALAEKLSVDYKKESNAINKLIEKHLKLASTFEPVAPSILANILQGISAKLETIVGWGGNYKQVLTQDEINSAKQNVDNAVQWIAICLTVSSQEYNKIRPRISPMLNLLKRLDVSRPDNVMNASRLIEGVSDILLNG